MITMKKPSECTMSELKNFEKVVASGDQVNNELLEDGIRQAQLLAFYYEDKDLAATVAIKTARQTYINRIFEEAGQAEKAKQYQFELGWAVTLKKYGSQGIAPKLIETLLNEYNNQDLFATTGVDHTKMEQILESNGFQKLGIPY